MSIGDGDGGADRSRGPDDDLERALRATLARHAGDIDTGPGWADADIGPAADAPGPVGRRSAGRIPVRRWLMPAAAAAMVIALVITGIAVRGAGSRATDATPGTVAGGTTRGSGTSSGTVEGAAPEILAPAPTPVPQQPIPAGMQAVDALGVEIFVPASLAVDPPCSGNSVSRPAHGLTYAIGCYADTGDQTTIEITTASVASTGGDPTHPCQTAPVLDGELGCLRVAVSAGSAPQVYSVIATWPQHDVAIMITVGMKGEQLALDVVESAHWVPVDRHGCAATRSPVVPAGIGALPEGSVLPDDATSTSVCWYSDGRLVASATLPSSGESDAQHSLASPPAPGNAPGIGTPPSYTPSPDGPACDALGRTEGIVFQATRPDGSIDVSAAQFADCTGGQFWTDAIHARPVDEALASALRGLTGFLLVFGYRATPLDPETSDVVPATANDLPATVSDIPPASTTSVITAARSDAADPSSPVTGESFTDSPTARRWLPRSSR